MIETTDITASILSGSSFTYKVRVESWLDGELLDDDVPIATGTEESDRSLRVPERVTLSVPIADRGTSYAPTEDDSPLAANGQRLRVLLGVGGRGTEVEWLQRGWFLIQDAQVDGYVVNVSAVGLLTLIDEARLVSPYQPTGTIGTTLRGLMEPALTVDLDNAPADRSVPSTINFDDDRLQAVLNLLDAWSADGYVDATGAFVVVAAGQNTTPVVTLSRSTTVVRAAGESSRENGYNVVVARGTASDGGQVQGIAYEYTGAKAYGGPFNPLPVPFYFPSPLLTTVTQCQAAANTVLERLRRTSTQRFKVDAVPDPRLQTGDVAALMTADYDLSAAAIESVQLPYTADGGPMRLGVRRLS